MPTMQSLTPQLRPRENYPPPCGATAALCAERPPEFDPEERATIALFSVDGIGPVTMDALRKQFGSLEAALAAPAREVTPLLLTEEACANYLRARDIGERADKYISKARALGARILLPNRPGWPRHLKGLTFPPVLYVRGTLEVDRTRLAVVGARQTDRYGEELAAFFAGSLARANVCIVSGGARGVDSAAHRAALGNHAPTIAVLGSGVDKVYPCDHRVLFDEIVARGGALVSHFPPGAPPLPKHFCVRNRLIAALCDAVLVTRAGRKSGALGTVQAARNLKRPVFATPGDLSNPLSCGTNALLESGEASLAIGVGPIARALALPPGDWPSAAAGGEPATRGRAHSLEVGPSIDAPREPIEVPAELAPVWAALGERGTQFEELLEKCGIDAPGLANALLRLEVIGLCQERAGKVFVRTQRL